eukprot:CAMPEP_0179218882 /NCGR_PEP_ID=MMETSP0797-20121207/4715_1 /TAXON_ID=47934 /ORGANISM="Dinophysis acuminata, Strain DAEP01" /LENGTH=792 /DNA_ID=CAMNT_0020925269 /DNA_START=78 /DNA_END=2456 /DNA_ORIENTATION=-
MSTSKKKVRLQHLDADPEQFALIVSFTTETTYFDEYANPIKAEKKPDQKVVKIPHGVQASEIPQLAQEVVDKCKYIPQNKVEDVERVLCMLVEYEASVQMQMQQQMQQQQQQQQQQHHTSQRMSASQSQQPPAREKQREQRQQDPLLPSADVRCLEEYADKLYEERMEVKVLGAKCILRVCTEPANLEILADHDTVLGVLSRELRESSKKSFELSVAIVCTFLCFSHFSQFHQALMQHQCGDVTMRVVEYESQRHQVRKADMDRRQMRLQELGDSATSDDRRLLAKDEKKFRIQLKRQNKLMHVCLMGLLNLAEDISVERKMVNRKIPLLLIQLIDRSHEDLLMVALQFLLKLSVFEMNKEAISTPGTLSQLVVLAGHSNVRIALLALRLLYNLSFDEAVRGSLVESGIMKLLVDHLKNIPFRHIVLRLLYHFSMDDRCKSLMAYHRDGMVLLLQLVVHFPEPRVGKDLVALVVNLATHPRAAEVMIGSGLFPQVLLRVLKTRDPLLCKVVRHVSSHKGVVEPMCELLESDSVRMSKWMTEFVRTAICCVDNPDLLVELLGVLANIDLPDIPWVDLCEAGLVDILTRLLVPSFSEDDIVLESVMLVSNLALSRESAQHVAGSRLPSMLQDLLIEKPEDDEIVVQILFAFQCLLLYEEVRDVVLQDTELAPCVMRFARARNPVVLELATKTLQIVAEFAGDNQGNSDAPSWIEQIKAFRFEQHNQEWCHYLSRELSGSAGMSPNGGYYDEQQDSGAEGEEEFAFHWAGGDAADAEDLINRDWRNMEEREERGW